MKKEIEVAEANKESVLKAGVDVGLIDWVDVTGEYFTFADSENMSDKLIEFAQIFYDMGQSEK